MKLWKKTIVMFVSVLVLTIGGIAVYGWTILNQSTNQLSKTYKSYRKAPAVLEATKPMTILLMGVDTGSDTRLEKWQGNSDTMILATVNPKTHTTTMMSLERDILATITGKNGSKAQAKINSAYANGGVEDAISTIESLMNTTIDRYMLINMKGLSQLVDAVGGITVNNTLGFPISIAATEPEYQAVVNPGKQEIDGEQALVYARMRYEDPEGDYGRQKRQREVIQQILKKILNLTSISRYQKILSAISDNLQTDIPINVGTLSQLLGYKKALKSIKTYQLKGESALINGISYQLVTSHHLLELQNVLRESLGQSTLYSLKSNAVLYDTYTGGYSYAPSESDVPYQSPTNNDSYQSGGATAPQSTTSETLDGSDSSSYTAPQGTQGVDTNTQ